MSKEKRMLDIGIMSEAKPSESLVLRQKLKGGGSVQFQHIPDEQLADFEKALEEIIVTDKLPKSVWARQNIVDPLTWRGPNVDRIIIH